MSCPYQNHIIVFTEEKDILKLKFKKVIKLPSVPT